MPLKEFEIPEEIFLVPEKDQETDIDLDGNETGVRNGGERDENESDGTGKTMTRTRTIHIPFWTM